MARIHVFYDTEENKYVASSVGTIPGAGGEYNSIDDMVNDIYKILIAWLAKYRKPKK